MCFIFLLSGIMARSLQLHEINLPPERIPDRTLIHALADDPVHLPCFLSSLPDVMLDKGEHFILRVHGNSMIDAGILDGDYVVVRHTSEAHNGDIIVAMIDDSCTVKRFYHEADGSYRLQPENKEMQPIFVRELTAMGEVISMFRLMR